VAKLILIVDDEQINREMIGSVLENAGYNVFKTGDARTAISTSMIYKEKICVILMDLVMPDNDGFLAITTIKSHRLTKLIPIMALTGSNDKESVIKAMNAGADDYLTKPFDPDELISRVHVLCKISDFVKRWDVIAK
jgi:DNA-binding response OmpR family regulator